MPRPKSNSPNHRITNRVVIKALNLASGFCFSPVMSLVIAGLLCTGAASADTPSKLSYLIDTMNNQYYGAEYVQAGRTAQQILKIDQDNLKAHYMMGNIFLKAELLENAAVEYQWCIAHGAKNSQEVTMAKQALASMSQAAASASAPAAATSLPQNQPLFQGQGQRQSQQQVQQQSQQQGQISRAASQAAAASATFYLPPPTVSLAPYAAPTSQKSALLMQTMSTQYKAGQYVQAGHTGQQILAIDPQNLEAHYLMGNIYLKAEALDQAGNEYDWCTAHGQGTQVGDYAQRALDVMEGRTTPGEALRAISQAKAASAQAAQTARMGQAIQADQAAQAGQRGKVSARAPIPERLPGLPITRQAAAVSVTTQMQPAANALLPVQFDNPFNPSDKTYEYHTAQNSAITPAPIANPTIASYQQRINAGANLGTNLGTSSGIYAQANTNAYTIPYGTKDYRILGYPLYYDPALHKLVPVKNTGQ